VVEPSKLTSVVLPIAWLEVLDEWVATHTDRQRGIVPSKRKIIMEALGRWADDEGVNLPGREAVKAIA